MRSPAARSLVLFATSTVLLGCSAMEPRSPPGPTPVRVRVVEKQGPQAGSRYSGTIEPATKVDVAFKIGGYIDSIAEVTSADGKHHPLQEGDWVKKGTLLLQVRKSDYLQKVAAARAALNEAAAGQRLAQADFERASKLAASQAMAKAQLDSAAAHHESADAQLQAATAQLSEAQLSLRDCSLEAPSDGVVLKRHVEVGTLVSPGVVGVTLADTRSVKVVFGAPDALVEKLRIGSPLVITIESVPGELTGHVTRIAPSADQQGRVFNVEATIPNPGDALRVGMIASLKISDGAAPEDGVVLPLTAVVRPVGNPRGFAAFVVEDRSQDGRDSAVARLREVELGDVLGNTIFVRKGLKAGERVVAMGATLLRDGDAVSIIP